MKLVLLTVNVLQVPAVGDFWHSFSNITLNFLLAQIFHKPLNRQLMKVLLSLVPFDYTSTCNFRWPPKPSRIIRIKVESLMSLALFSIREI